jgi:hypothetical protein
MARPLIRLFANPNQNDDLERIIDDIVESRINEYNKKLALFLKDNFSDKFFEDENCKMGEVDVLKWYSRSVNNHHNARAINEAIDLLRRNGFQVTHQSGDGGAW